MSSRANLVKTTGLETSGNELQRSEGSLNEALNVNIDERSVITPRRGFKGYANYTNDAMSEDINDKIKQVFEYKNRLFRHYNSSIEFENESGSFSPITGNYQEIIEGYRIKYQETKGNMYFTTSEGVKKFSIASESDINTNAIISSESVGSPKGSDLFATVFPSASGSGFLPPQSKVGYRVLFGKKDNNNNLILGSPSARFVVTNFTDDVSLQETSSVTINDYTQINDGDYFIINTLNQKYTAYFFVTTDTVPKKSDTIGSTYIKVDISAASSNADAASILANELGLAISQATVEIDSLNTDRVLVTNNEEGDIEDIVSSVIPTVGFSVQTLNDGSVTQGTFANCNVTFTLPSDINDSYFYQLYRTNTITTSDGLTLNDLDPGDEMNLVIEEAITLDNIASGEIEILDEIPESFRSQGAFLYTNEVSGEGILQANEQPPVALDIALFNNCLFYANTKSKHRLDFSIVSVDDFINSSTRFILANSDVTRYYTFSGLQNQTTITTGTKADTVNGGTILINSSQNLRKYAIYFDKDNTATPPSISGRTNIRVDITQAISDVDVAESLDSALFNIGDFEVSQTGNEVVITNNDNGESDAVDTITSDPVVDLGTGFSIVTDVIGVGEIFDTPEGGEVLLSNLASVGQAIDQTARSLVKVINRDTQSPVNAYYLSGTNDLPGKILLENKNLATGEFYVALQEDSNDLIGQEIIPSGPLVKPIEQIDGLGTTTQITVTGHGYSNGENVYVGYKKLIPSDPDEFEGKYTISNVTANTFEIQVSTPITVIGFVPQADNTSVFKTLITSDNLESGNRLYFSKLSEPEAVPITNFIDIGPQDEPIERILPLRDNLFVLKSDGVYIVSGTSPFDFNVRNLDSTQIIAPDTAVVLNNQIYCLTEQGITIITDSGVGVISSGIEDLVDNVTNKTDYRYKSFSVAYENDRAFLMFTPKSASDITATQCFRYNIFEQTWTRWEIPVTCGVALERDLKLYLGDGDENLLLQERKDFERSDFAGKEFERELIRLGNNTKELVMGSNVSIEKNDVIIQTQLVTNNYFNRRLLVKMDTFENGLTPPINSTFVDTFSVDIADDIVAALQALNDYLFILDPTGITNKSFDNNNYRTLTETLVDELNDLNTITTLKNYKKPETVVFETYITEVDTSVVENKIIVAQERPFQKGFSTIFKHIDKKVEWNPQHFGDPSALKQISQASLMLDQNNFSEGVLSFFTDVEQGVTRVPFTGKGIGYWSDLSWGDPNAYWGGEGNDIPFRTLVPRGKQKCRYLSVIFEHFNARETFRIVGISGVVRVISSKAYK